MVKFITIAAAAMAGLASTVFADECRNNGIYCGSALLGKGNYFANIIEELEANGQSTDQNHVEQSLFVCGDDKGAAHAHFQAFCPNGCQGGDKKNDFCI
ncbi:hypothetical protein F4677DRAFT_119323 [Hypoxylon crocopeplum]|nr:hypothetical protein F4677DRAFT_119323 [Hypoxylon crocopeplum]